MVFEQGQPKSREVDRLSADVETLCRDWHRMRAVIDYVARNPWWDLRTLCCLYCHGPFEISGGECQHEVDCVYERCCEIVSVEPVPLPDQAAFEEWKKQTPTPLSF